MRHEQQKTSEIRDDCGRKKCARCKRWFLPKFFSPSYNKSDNLHSWCKDCCAEARRLNLRKGGRRKPLEVQVRDEYGRKKCRVCMEWLEEICFSTRKHNSDGLLHECRRCKADNQHNLTPELRRQMLKEQNGRCPCGREFDLYGGVGKTYHIDHDHSCCPGKKSCGNCIRRWLLCMGCNLRDAKNPERKSRAGSASKYRGVTYNPQSKNWQLNFHRSYDDEDEAGAAAQRLELFLQNNPEILFG